ncbi:uncharacterized protein LOC110092522 [Dendrobium catenatum]|uniref:uncharacterized protein LOC110092522 n=1 Tax=Dendrobium catenatum TaxID=906689 RepID=UPI0009F5B5FC|nr:uncharacterized protein LOC110092522 [Dendrobium catenatum]
MDPSVYSTSFPPLPNSSSPLPNPGTSCPLPWDRVFSDPPVASEFNISALPTPEEIIDFPTEDIAEAVEEYNLALVGYSLGKRPYYEALLKAVTNLWKLKGTIKLISLSEGFFLFEFSCAEDYEMVWTKGAWFIFGRPFIFKKWSSHFSPERIEYTNIPIWFKIHDLPLCCWTPIGISKIATKVGIPLAVDALTASKSRLTYARVCVQIDSSATYPAFIPIIVEGKLFNLKIQYEWRPSVCDLCKSFNHLTDACPSNPNPKPPLPPVSPRGRSTSRRPRPPSKNPKGILPTPRSSTEPRPEIPDNQDATTLIHPNYHEISAPTEPEFNSLNNDTTKLTEKAQEADTDIIMDVSCIQTDSVIIPNLNSPTQQTSSSSDLPAPLINQAPLNTSSPNKFSLLQNLSDSDSTYIIEPDNASTASQLQNEQGKFSPPSSSKPNSSKPNNASHSQPLRNTRGKGAKKGSKSK